MRTKKDFESMGFIFITLGGGAVAASKIYKKDSGEITEIGATAKTLPTLRKRLEDVVESNIELFA